MEETYWKLFWATGAPVFYLLYREEGYDRAEAKPAGASNAAAEI